MSLAKFTLTTAGSLFSSWPLSFVDLEGADEEDFVWLGVLVQLLVGDELLECELQLSTPKVEEEEEGEGVALPHSLLGDISPHTSPLVTKLLITASRLLLLEGVAATAEAHLRPPDASARCRGENLKGLTSLRGDAVRTGEARPYLCLRTREPGGFFKMALRLREVLALEVCVSHLQEALLQAAEGSTTTTPTRAW